MNTLSESLRALEKEVREHARVSDRAGMTGVAEDFRDVADRLSALLESDRQEVAPVADERADPEKVICPGCCHQFHAISVRDQERLRATGQTSDARDIGSVEGVVVFRRSEGAGKNCVCCDGDHVYSRTIAYDYKANRPDDTALDELIRGVISREENEGKRVRITIELLERSHV